MYGPTIIITCILVLLTFALPRKYFLIPFILTVSFIPFDQRVIIGGLDFTPLRILLVIGVLRTFLRSEARHIKWNVFDKMIFAWAAWGAIAYIIQQGNMSAVINRSGVTFDIVGLYWLFRQNIRSWDDVDFIARAFAAAALVSALMVLLERGTGCNPFQILGRVYTGMHRGRYRCRGSFQHSIMLGLFWVNLIPIFVGYALTNRAKAFYWWMTAAACVLIVFSSGSSTTLVTLLWILLLLPLFAIRQHGKVMAFGLLGSIAGLHLVMNKPVWHLIGRVRIISGSTGYHRYRLIDAAVKHFDEWAFVGIRNTEHWGYGLFDITNNYIRQGVNGGVVTLGLFIVVLVMAISICGRYSLRKVPRKEQWLAWAFCVSVLAHCMSFLGVSYFGKIPMLLYLTFAVVAMVYDMSRSPSLANRFTLYEPYRTQPQDYTADATHGPVTL
ncbi:MAG: hypothetical protein JXB29_11950 [Sedimentisphaerales bacterium]|nr:hypothetical protein [Sedimentisphaerales bacterium]